MVKSWVRSTAIAAGAVAVLAGSAGAQTFNFGTTGEFGGGCAAGPSVTAVCNIPGSGLVLTFTGEPVNSLNYGNGSTVTLGNFAITGQGNAVLNPGDVTFTLWINQTHPTVGTGYAVGSITGSIMRNTTTASGGLIWTPNEIVDIDPVMYDIIFEQGVNGINISAANNSSVQAVGTVVPEPSTYALMAAGLAGMAVVARRRRKNA